MKSWLTEHSLALLDTFTRMRRQPLSLLLNVLVVAIALALPLAGFTVLSNLQPLTAQLTSEPEISVFMRLDTPRAEAEALGNRLRALPGVGHADFISREDALARLKQQPGMSDMIATLNQNPLPDAWVLHLRTDSAWQAGLSTLSHVVSKGSGADAGTAAISSAANAQQALADQIGTWPKVEHVQIDSVWVRRMEALVRFLRLALGILAGTLGVAVIAVIFNTIRLQVLTQREEIEVSKLIGATDRFIRRPFYYTGAFLALAGGMLALGLVALALWPLNQALGDFARLYAAEFRFHALAWQEAAVFLGISAALGWMGALFSVNRHLAGLGR